MKILNLFLTILGLALLFTTSPSLGALASQSCELSNPTIIKDEGDILLQYWDLAGSFELHESVDFNADPSLADYYSSLKDKYDTSVIALLNASLKYENRGNKKNIELVLSNTNKIRKINFLESKLLSI